MVGGNAEFVIETTAAHGRAPLGFGLADQQQKPPRLASGGARRGSGSCGGAGELSGPSGRVAYGPAVTRDAQMGTRLLDLVLDYQATKQARSEFGGSYDVEMEQIATEYAATLKEFLAPTP
jgi:hypothetical protein